MSEVSNCQVIAPHDIFDFNIVTFWKMIPCVQMASASFIFTLFYVVVVVVEYLGVFVPTVVN